MNYEEFQKLGIKEGSRILVTWFDAAENHNKSYRPLKEEEAITIVQSEGVFFQLYTSAFYPDFPHLVLYEGERDVYVPKNRRVERRHVFLSIPLVLVKDIEVLKRARRAVKAPTVYYVVEVGESVKKVIRVKECVSR